MLAARRFSTSLFRLALTTTALAAIIIASVACSGGDDSAGARGGELTGVRWALTSYVAEGSPVPVPEDVSADAIFTEDQLSGQAGVNQFSAPYTANEDGDIEVGEIASTMIVGTPEANAVESAVYSGLDAAASYYADDATLALYDESGGTLLVYEKQERTSLVGTDWLVTNYNNGEGAVVSTIGDVDLTAVFAESGEVSGFSGVNRYSGPYRLDGESIQIGPLTGTTMAGEPELVKQEQQFLAALQSATKVVAAGDQCNLRAADGGLAVMLIRRK